jgi:tRNA(fMet)-specific endonuclease VapC
MNYVFDTDIIIYWLKGNKQIENRVLEEGIEKISISFVTLSELFYGAYKSQRKKENIANVKMLIQKIECVETNPDICNIYGKLKAVLEKEGKIIDDADLFIAATALDKNMVLVTNNTKHFNRINGLRLENWSKL